MTAIEEWISGGDGSALPRLIVDGGAAREVGGRGRRLVCESEMARCHFLRSPKSFVGLREEAVHTKILIGSRESDE